jgi:hypothetical protein
MHLEWSSKSWFSLTSTLEIHVKTGAFTTVSRYPVFKEKVYPMMIGMMLERVRRDPSVYIDAAFRALIDANANRDPDDVASEDLPSHPPLFETQIGTETITLPTFGNPIMTGLYSLLFVCFAQITKL